jgi:hypothetical protein
VLSVVDYKYQVKQWRAASAAEAAARRP